MDLTSPSLSMDFNLKCQNVNQYSETDGVIWSSLIEGFDKMKKLCRRHITQSLCDFIHVKYHSTDIEEETSGGFDGRISHGQLTFLQDPDKYQSTEQWK